jgi:hypothetical protein
MTTLRLLSCSAAVALTFSGCDTLSRPIGTGEFDPLMTPGNKRPSATADASGFVPGRFVEAAMDNTGFFKKKPKGDANADRLLKARTPMKIIAVEESYLKVELDNGEVGYVPSILVSDPNAVPTSTGNAVQIYPPVPSGSGDAGQVPIIPLDPADPQAPATDKLPEVKPDGATATPAAPAADTPKPNGEKPADAPAGGKTE